MATQPLIGFTIYTAPIPPCSNCASKIAQVGIKRVVAPVPKGEVAERYRESFKLSKYIYKQKGIELELFDV